MTSCCGVARATKHTAHSELEKKRKRGSPLPCHHYRIVFTDGACTNNGRPDAISGIGIAFGARDFAQQSVAITDEVDDFPLRSNQRAELLAAEEGLEYLSFVAEYNSREPKGARKVEAHHWIIATDSQYVVKGMTEWLPKWRKNDWRTANGTKPANLDLFLRFDDLVTYHEERNIKIGFWHVPREYNKIADRLAKKAARDGHMATRVSGL